MTDPIPEAMCRRADRLGLVLGAAVIALLVGCMALFHAYGLPKDATEAKRLEQRAAERAAQSASQRDLP
jgi:hypothetical protein